MSNFFTVSLRAALFAVCVAAAAPASAQPKSAAAAKRGADMVAQREVIYMNTTGVQTVTTCDAVIYDDGGPGANYANNCNGVLQLLPAGANQGVSLSGDYDMEQDFDMILVYNGLEMLDDYLLATLTGAGSIQGLASTVGPLTLKVVADVSVNAPGFHFQASCVAVNTSCLPPTGLAASGATATSVTLGWTSDNTQWNLEYGPRGFAQGQGTMVAGIDSNPFTLTGLTPATAYDFLVQAACDDAGASDWSPRGSFTTAVACDPGMAMLQTVVGQGGAQACDAPVDTRYGYSYTQQIYTAAELDALGVYGGQIKSLAFRYLHQSPQTRDNCRIYIGHTDKSHFADTEPFITVLGMTLAYEGDMPFDASAEGGWCETILQTPFDYDGVRNLVVGVACNHGSSATGSEPTFGATATAAGQPMALAAANDYVPYDPATTVHSGAALGHRADIRLSTCAPAAAFVAVAGQVTALADGQPLAGARVDFRGPHGATAVADAQGRYAAQLLQGQVYQVTASANGHSTLVSSYTTPSADSGTHDIALGRPVMAVAPADGIQVATHYLASATAAVTVANTGDGPLHWTASVERPAGRADGQVFSYDFAQGTDGWSFIDVNADGHVWGHSSQGLHGSIAPVPGHDAPGSMVSESLCLALGQPLAPDDLLLSPAKYSLDYGASITFWARTSDPEAPAEHFGVAVSAGAAYTDQFATVAEWDAAPAGAWTRHTVSLDAYAGSERWLAIRHFGGNGQSALVVDDITVATGGELPPAPVATWLALGQEGGTVPPGQSQQLDLLLDARYAQQGTFQAQVVVASHDPEAGLASVPVTFTIEPPLCDAPQGLVARAVSFDDIRLEWQAPAQGQGLAGYNIYRAGYLTPEAEVGPEATAHTFYDLYPGAHAYEVRARYASGCVSPATEPASAVTGLPQGAVAGSVTSAATGEPVAGARVAFADTAVVADAQGAFDLMLLVGDHDYRASATGYAGVSGSISVAEGQNQLDIALQPIPCDAPAAPAVALAGRDAALTWDIPGRPAERATLYSQDFESTTTSFLPDGWAAIDADGDGLGWQVLNSPFMPGHYGQAHLTSASFDQAPLAADNYVVMPPLPAGAALLTYFVAAQEASFPRERYAVVASSGGAEPADFDIVLLDETLVAAPGAKGQGEWHHRSVAIPAGARYVAFRHAGGEPQLRVNIDDVAVLGDAPSEAAFNVYRNDALLASDIHAQSYIDANLADGDYQYRVSMACPVGGESPLSDAAAVVVAPRGVDFVVTGPDGQPLAGASVAVGGQTLTTGPDGRAGLPLYDGGYGYAAALAGYNELRGSVAVAGADVEIAVELLPLPGLACPAPEGLQADVDGRDVALAWSPGQGTARVTLEAHDVFGDGTGYQILLDPDCSTYSQYATGNLQCGTSYADWEYTIPANATAADDFVVVDGKMSVDIPAGAYDYLVVNPGCGLFSTVYVAHGQCDPSRGERVEFRAGAEYRFTMAIRGDNDCVTITATALRGQAQGERYNVYRDGQLVAQGVDAPAFADTNLADGTYRYHVAQVCGEGESAPSAEAVAVVAAAGVPGGAMSAAPRLYPNPAGDQLRVDFDGAYSSLSVVDMLGQTVLRADIGGRSCLLDLAGLAAGAYHVRLSGAQGVAVAKFMKR